MPINNIARFFTYDKLSFILGLCNFKKNNNIRSKRVSLNATLGRNIEIMSGTMIDKYSKIGSYTYIGYNCSITKSDIGCYVSIANNVTIGPGEHQLDKISTSSLFYENPYETLTQKNCLLGNDVWIGVDSIIKRGVIIGDGAVIGANSFVTHDIPSFAIAVGSPAKVIKYRFSKQQIDLICSSKWWDLNLEEAKKAIQEIQSKLDALL